MYVIEDKLHFFLQNTYFKSEWTKYIATPQNVYMIMSRTDISSNISISKYLLSTFTY